MVYTAFTSSWEIRKREHSLADNMSGSPSWLPLPPLPARPVQGGCLLVVGSWPLSPSDTTLRELLTWLCEGVRIAIQNEWPYLGTAGLALGVVTGTCTASLAGLGPAIPLLIVGSPMVDMQLVASAAPVLSASLQIQEHLLAGDYKPGHVPVYERPGKILAGAACSDDAILIGHPSFARSAWAYLAYEAGGMLCGGYTAPARRVALGLAGDAFSARASSRVTVQAVALVSAAAMWLADLRAADTLEALSALEQQAAGRIASDQTNREYIEYARARESLAIAASGGPRGVHHELADLAWGPLMKCPLQRCNRQIGRSPSVTVLVHTCDAYTQFWQGWALHFARNWNHSLCWPVAFANEAKHAEAHAVLGPLKDCALEADRHGSHG